MFTAALAQPPSASDRCVARRARLDRLSLPLGSNFLIMAPPQVPFALVLKAAEGKKAKREIHTKAELWNVLVLFSCIRRRAGGSRRAKCGKHRGRGCKSSREEEPPSFHNAGIHTGKGPHSAALRSVFHSRAPACVTMRNGQERKKTQWAFALARLPFSLLHN